MEIVKAYKACNGKLFNTEEECVKYEKKITTKPKITHKIGKVVAHYWGNQLPIYKHTLTIKQKYNTPTITKTYYEFRDAKNSFFIIAKPDVILTFTSKEHSITNYLTMYGASIRDLLLDDVFPFSTEFLEKLNEKVQYLNENGDIRYRTRKENLKCIVVNFSEKTIAIDVNSHGGLVPLDITISLDEKEIISHLFGKKTLTPEVCKELENVKTLPF